VGADYNGLSIDPSVFSMTAQLMPGKDPAEIEREIDSLVEPLKSDLISDRELQKAKNQIESAFIYGQDSIFGQAMKIGYYEAVGDWRLMDSYLDGIRKVTRQDIQRVAQEYLDRDRRTVGVLVPSKEIAP
jgi:zinc protease